MPQEQFSSLPSKDNDSNQASQEVGGFLMEIVKVFILAVIIILPIRVFLFQPFFVQGASMEPNFHNGEYLLINEWGYKHTNIGFASDPLMSVKPFRDLNRSDVVVFRYPKNPSVFYVKRVVGLPGETITLEKGQIRISLEDGSSYVLDESPYIPDSVHTEGGQMVTLGEDEYFVMGDNREHSNDSRSWGPVSKEFIIGKVFVRMWPLDHFGLID